MNFLNCSPMRLARVSSFGFFSVLNMSTKTSYKKTEQCNLQYYFQVWSMFFVSFSIYEKINLNCIRLKLKPQKLPLFVEFIVLWSILYVVSYQNRIIDILLVYTTYHIIGHKSIWSDIFRSLARSLARLFVLFFAFLRFFFISLKLISLMRKYHLMIEQSQWMKRKSILLRVFDWPILNLFSIV